MPRARGRPPRRYYFFKYVTATAAGDDGLADAWREKRLAETGTVLPAAFPWRALALAAGVLAIEDLDGASARAIEGLGLSYRVALAIFNRLEGVTVPTVYFASSPRAGEPYDQDEVVIMASGARTVSVDSDVYEVGDRGAVRLDLAVTAVAGTLPTLHVQIETREAAASGTWRVVDAFTVATAVSAQRKVFAGLDRFVRAVCTLGGTGSPSLTFSLSGAAV